MSRVQAEGKLYFIAPSAVDIVNYDLFWRRPGQSWEEGQVHTGIEPEAVDDHTMCIDLALYDIMVEAKGRTEFSIAAVDDAGNVSDTSEVITVDFNLKAPAKPLSVYFSPD